MHESRQESQQLPGLNGLRALAVAAVIVSHVFFGRTDIYILRFLSGGWGVTLFFVISGFLITTLLLGEFRRLGKIDIQGFYLRRAVRILPPAYFFLFCVFILTASEVIDVSSASLLSALLFLKNLPIPGVPYDWHLGHFWSLAVEEQYYMMLPIILLVAGRYISTISLLMIILSLAATFLSFHVFKYSLSVKLVAAFTLHQVPLLIGTLFALLNARHPDVKQKISSPIVALCLGLSMLSLSTENMLLPNLVKPLFAALFAATAILGAINTADGILGWLLNNAVTDFIGRISYSLYLWQQLFTSESIIRTELDEIYTTPLNLLAILTFAVGSYYIIERPLFKVRRRLRNRSLGS